MTVRKSERPTSGRLGKSTPGFGKTPGVGKTTPFVKTPQRTSKRPPATQVAQNFAATWPLFGDAAAPAFPAHPATTVHQLAPASADLAALAGRSAPPSETARQTDRQRQKLAGAPASTDEPEWLRAAKSLAEWLETRIASGSVEPVEQAAIARAWAAFCLGGATEPQILRVSHIVQRAHTAIRDTPRGQQDLQAAFHAAAGVLHAGLPAVIRQRMPLERVVYVVRRLREEADPWTAIVQGATELLGWTDYARVHAATAIRAVLERSRAR